MKKREEKQYIQLHYLIARSVENKATEEEMSTLQSLLLKNDDLLRYYFRVMEMYSGLHHFKRVNTSRDLTKEECDGLFREFAEYEKSAPEIKVLKEEPERGRLHIDSPLMGESLVSKELLRRTEQ